MLLDSSRLFLLFVGKAGKPTNPQGFIYTNPLPELYIRKSLAREERITPFRPSPTTTGYHCTKRYEKGLITLMGCCLDV